MLCPYPLYPLPHSAPLVRDQSRLEPCNPTDTITTPHDEQFLTIALAEALQAAAVGNAPIGAVLVSMLGHQQMTDSQVD